MYICVAIFCTSKCWRWQQEVWKIATWKINPKYQLPTLSDQWRLCYIIAKYAILFSLEHSWTADRLGAQLLFQKSLVRGVICVVSTMCTHLISHVWELCRFHIIAIVMLEITYFYGKYLDTLVLVWILCLTIAFWILKSAKLTTHHKPVVTVFNWCNYVYYIWILFSINGMVKLYLPLQVIICNYLPLYFSCCDPYYSHHSCLKASFIVVVEVSLLHTMAKRVVFSVQHQEI